MFLLQMAGWTGTGKSSVAHALAQRTGAVILDHDTTKSALLRVVDDASAAGHGSYEVLFDVAADSSRARARRHHR